MTVTSDALRNMLQQDLSRFTTVLNETVTQTKERSQPDTKQPSVDLENEKKDKGEENGRKRKSLSQL